MAEMTREEIARCIERFGKKKAGRSNAEVAWQEIRDYMLPNRPSFYTEELQPKSAMSKIFDGTAIDAINVCKAGVNGMLTNAALPWHAIEMENQAYNNNDEVRNALQEVNSIMQIEYHNSNFYTNIDGIYEEVIGFGESCLFINEGKRTTLNFYPVPLKYVWTDEDSEGNVDTVFRIIRYTARQARQEFPNGSLSKEMEDCLKAKGTHNGDKKFDILHIVYPRTDREYGKKDKFNKVFRSAYIAVEEQHLIEEGGYDEFPYAIPRLFLSDDGYGRGLGHNALPDVKMMNTMEKTGLRSWQKAADPPTQGPDEGLSLPIKTGPGGHTYNSNWDKQGSEIKTLYPTGSFQMLPNFESKCDKKRAQIQEFFFYRQFRTQQQGQPRTAQEIIQIASENLKILGPLLNRFTEELLKPIIQRSFHILYRAGRFPLLQRIIRAGQIPLKFKIVYLSPIAKAQRLYEAQELQNAITLVAPAMQIEQTVLDNFDGDKYFNLVATIYPALQKVSRDEDDVLAIREERAQQQEEQKQKQDASLTLQGLEMASKTDPTTGLLGALSGNVGMQ